MEEGDSSPEARRHGGRQLLLFLLKLTASASLIAFLVGRIGAAAVGEQLARLPLWAFAAAVVLQIGQVALVALRWTLVGGQLGLPLGFADSFRMWMVSQFFGQVLPSSFGGDAVRLAIAVRAGMSWRAVLNSILADRVVGLAVLALLAVLLSPLAFAQGVGRGVGLSIIAYAAIVLSVAAAIVLFPIVVPATLRRFRPVGEIERFSSDLRRVLSPNRALTKILMLAVLGHLLLPVCVFILALGLGLPLSLFDALLLVVPVQLFLSLPLSVAGWGLREGAMIVMLGFAGIAAPQALAVSALLGVTTIGAAMPGSLFWLRERRTRTYHVTGS